MVELPVIVVSGLPRSGTSLVMSMLGAAGVPLLVDGERPPDAHNPWGYFEYAPVRRARRRAGWVAQAGGRAVKVVTPLLASLPTDRRYRVVLLDRPVADVVASQRRMDPGLPDADALVRDMTAHLAAVHAWLTTSPAFDLHVVSFDDLRRDPVPVARALGAFVSAPWEPMVACVRPAGSA
jgi:hypothetical protein